MKLKHRIWEWLSRLSGFQPWGLSWTTTPTERAVVSALVVEFENHRVLWDSGCGQDRKEMIESVETLRIKMTEAIQQLKEESATRVAVQHLRDCCIDFQSWLERDGFSIDGFGAPSEDFYGSAGALDASCDSSQLDMTSTCTNVYQRSCQRVLVTISSSKETTLLIAVRPR
jgi:hypothetical protein